MCKRWRPHPTTSSPSTRVRCRASSSTPGNAYDVSIRPGFGRRHPARHAARRECFHEGGNLEVPGEHALSVAGGMFIPPRRWVYYSLMINWLDGEGGDVPKWRARLSVLASRFSR